MANEPGAQPALSLCASARPARRLGSKTLLAIGGLWALLSAWAGPGAPDAAAAPGFSFESVVARAKEVAARPFQDPRGEVPAFLMKLDYDQWRDIRFNPRRSLWREDPLLFTAQFFHPGLYYDRMVWVNVVEGAKAHRLRFDPDFFSYGKNNFPARELRKLGFAGFRLHYPLNTPDYFDEVMVFLGASYFRALAKGQVYGLSARGLAIDTVLPSGEEFPIFREFWLVKPAAQAGEIEIFALLDSTSVAGAYRFLVRPEATARGEKAAGSVGGPADAGNSPRETRIDVQATLFFRRPVQKPGFAPLTSMFFYGENSSIRPVDDFRPEIHDSDGLLVHFASGEWLWRPLVNSRGFQVNSYATKDPAGFGLLQRDRDFDHYQDLETHYENRPSVWISPQGSWGEGRIELVQIPVNEEIIDNIVAYWVPGKAPVPGQPVSFAYTMSWAYAEQIGHPGGRVAATRTAEGMVKIHRVKSLRKFVVDFEGGRLEALAAGEPVAAVVDVAQPAVLVETQVEKNRITGGWRLVLLIDTAGIPESSQVTPVELRAFLTLAGDVLTETWSYTYLHEQGHRGGSD